MGGLEEGGLPQFCVTFFKLAIVPVHVAILCVYSMSNFSNGALVGEYPCCMSY